MDPKKTILVIALLIIQAKCNSLASEYTDSLANNTVVVQKFVTTNSSISVTDKYSRGGEKTLRWDWEPYGLLMINSPDIDPTKILDYYSHTTEIWVYNESPSDQALTFQYLDAQAVINYQFDFKLDFTGWNRILASYVTDMQKINKPTANVARIVVKAPTQGSGTIFFGDWKYVVPYGTRVVTKQMPNITGFQADPSYYLASINEKDIDLADPTASQLKDLASIRKSFGDWVIGPKPNNGDVQGAIKYYKDLNIVVDGQSIKGRATTPQEANTFLYLLAKDYIYNKEEQSLKKVENILWLINDLGYADGSNLVYGWYDTVDYFNGLMLAYPYLSAGLQDKLFKAVVWTLKMGQLWEKDPSPGWDSDFVCNNLHYVLGIIVSLKDDAEAVRWLKGFKRFLERRNVPSSGILGWIKLDGTTFHHGGHYNGYLYSFNRYTIVLNFLYQTQFQINTTAYITFREAAYNILLMANKVDLPNSLCGRHPFNATFPMQHYHYSLLAIIGGSILGTPVDTKIAGSYNRIWADDEKLKDYPPQSSPVGFWQFNFSPIGVYRRDNWVVTIHGMNSKFWGTQIYVKDNRFGRYQSYGSIEVMYDAGAKGSGYSGQGYDWNKPPGTTTRQLPWEKLNPTYQNFNQAAASDFAAALRFETNPNDKSGKYGMYGFYFKESPYTPSHDATFTFKKSMFCFDDLIISLGSDISCGDGEDKVITTLFQSSLPKPNTPMIIDGNSINDYPFTTELGAGTHWIVDPWGTGYYMKIENAVTVTRLKQKTPNEANTGFDNGDFATAFIDHGIKPQNGGYEYIVIPDMLNGFMKRQNGQKMYDVIEKSSNAHIVHYYPAGITAYCLFTPNPLLSDKVLRVNSAPCLVMLREQDGVLNISVVDPAPSFTQNSTILLTIAGEYTLVGGSEGAKLVESGGGKTELAFTPRQGFAQDISLKSQSQFIM